MAITAEAQLHALEVIAERDGEAHLELPGGTLDVRARQLRITHTIAPQYGTRRVESLSRDARFSYRFGGDWLTRHDAYHLLGTVEALKALGEFRRALAGGEPNA